MDVLEHWEDEVCATHSFVEASIHSHVLCDAALKGSEGLSVCAGRILTLMAMLTH